MGLIGRAARLVADTMDHQSAVDLESGVRRVLELEAPLGGPELVSQVVDRMVGLGPIQSLVDDQSVTDVLVNGPDEVWVDRGGDLERVDVSFDSTAELMATVERAISALGLRVDRSSPTVEARLPDGSRLHVAIPPATVDNPVMAIRRFSPAVRTLGQLEESGSVRPNQAHLLKHAVTTRRNVIVSGGTGSGKTTLLNVLAGEIDPSERLVTVEDAAELDFPGHVVRLEARPPNAEGYGAISMRDLLKSALRLRPDRIILGEVRGKEALDLVTALNTGHSGSMSTVHANSPEEALWRLETLALLDGAGSAEAIRRQLYAAVDVVVQVSREDGQRGVVAICSVGTDGAVEVMDDG